MAGMEGLRNGSCATNLNGGGQNRMQCADEFSGIMRPIGIKVKALPASVNACIGSPAPMGFKGLIEDLAERSFEDILNTLSFGLSLPAVKISAVVGANAFPSHVWMLAKAARDARL